MNAFTLAEEIINGRRITREDDLSFFLTCDLEELCEGADKIREARIGDKVDLCSIINGRSGRCPEFTASFDKHVKFTMDAKEPYFTYFLKLNTREKYVEAKDVMETFLQRAGEMLMEK